MMKWFQLAVAVGLCVLAAGCGEGGTSVDGKVTNGGAPYALPAGDQMSVVLIGGDGRTFGGEVGPDGTFHVRSATGGGIPAGRYAVNYTHYPAGVGGKGAAGPVTRKMPEAWDVSPTAKTFTLDIATPAKK